MSSATEQPALFVFVATYYELITDEENKEFLLQVTYSTWIAYKNKYVLGRELKIQEIEKMDEDEEKRLTEISKNEDELMEEAINRITDHPQPELMMMLFKQVGDFFQIDDLKNEEIDDNSNNDAGLISGVINMFINLLEKARQPLYAS